MFITEVSLVFNLMSRGFTLIVNMSVQAKTRPTSLAKTLDVEVLRRKLLCQVTALDQLLLKLSKCKIQSHIGPTTLWRLYRSAARILNVTMTVTLSLRTVPIQQNSSMTNFGLVIALRSLALAT